MRKRLKATALGLAALCCVAAAAGTPDYKETTTVKGKIPLDLRGVWLLVAQAETPGGFKTFPQLLKISGTKGGLAMHLMDVRLPKEIVQAVRESDSTPTPWAPSAEDLKGLRKQWATLPPATKKNVAAGDVVYQEVNFTTATPERYAEVFPGHDAKLMAETVFCLEVVEKYGSQPLPPGSNIGQLALRKSVYGVRSVSDALLEGRQAVAFLAMGSVAPVPLSFGGMFKMYRLASPDEKKR